MYDIFAVSKTEFDKERWKEIQNFYPTAILCENVQSFDEVSKKSFTKMFWVIWDNITFTGNYNLNNYRATEWDNNYIHVFRNGDFFDGVCLFPKNAKVSSKEFEYRFFVKKKEIDICATVPILQEKDIIFISYNEPNAEQNWDNLKTRFSDAKRIDGVKGIHQAHIEAAKLSKTELFWVVDGDSKVLDSFNFDYRVEEWNKDAVHVWQSINPVNGLVYGYGGVKLLPKTATLNMDLTKTDMTTSIGNKLKCVTTVSNITEFNTDPFNAWKSAFRECVKLASRTIARQNDAETEERLQRWCTAGSNRQFGEYAIKGALAGKEYGETNKNNPESLRLINNFKWLEDQFNEI